MRTKSFRLGKTEAIRVAIAGVKMQLWFKAFINLLGFKIHFASKLAFGNRFGFKTCKSLGGEHRLFTGRRFSPPMTSPFLGKL